MVETVIEEKPNGLMVLIDSTVTEPETKRNLLSEFKNFFELTQEWKEKAAALVVTDAGQIDLMQQASEARKMLKAVRIDTEKTRKRLKEDSLRRGQSIDAIAKLITNEIIPAEKHLEAQEKFIELQEAKRLQELKEERAAILKQYDFEPEYYDLETMPENVFNTLVLTAKTAQADKIEAEKKAAELEAERQAKEAAEKERLRLENEKLRQEAEEREKAYRAEKEAEQAAQKAEAERLAKEAAQAEQVQELAADGFVNELLENGFIESVPETYTKGGFSVTRDRLKSFSFEGFKTRLSEINALIEQKEAARKAKAEADRLEAEKQARIKEDAKKAAILAEQKRKEAAAPDRTKLMNFANMLLGLELPKCETQEATKTITDTKNLIMKTAAFVKQRAADL